MVLSEEEVGGVSGVVGDDAFDEVEFFDGFEGGIFAVVGFGKGHVIGVFGAFGALRFRTLVPPVEDASVAILAESCWGGRRAGR